MTGDVPAASVIIPTRNRCELLAKSVRSSLEQSMPVEVIVLDDGSTDNTPAMIRREFPNVRYERYEGGRGPCFLRNRGAEIARAAILFPIDDDSIFVSPRTIEQTLAEFSHPRVGAIGMPFINVRYDEHLVRQIAPDDARLYVTHAFIGCAHAVRRDVFRSVNGYREQFFYMGEEGDLSIRLLNSGYVVRLGRADPVHHFESPLRNLNRADFSGRRNDVLFAWHNVPMPYFLPHVLAATTKGIAFGLRIGRPRRALQGLASGYWWCLRNPGQRHPISRDVYRLQRMLKKRAIVPLGEIEPALPPISPPSPTPTAPYTHRA